MYEYLLFFHVLLAVVWVGGGLTMLFIAGRLRMENDADKMAGFGGHAEWVGTHIYLPASILLFLGGAWMVIDVRHDREARQLAPIRLPAAP